MAQGKGERATGARNTIYDLASVLYHSLEGGANYEQYVQDAQEAGDEVLADFFTRVRDEDSMRADEARILLAERTPTAPAHPEGAMTRTTTTNTTTTAEPAPTAPPPGRPEI